jgi:hypothetical protein
MRIIPVAASALALFLALAPAALAGDAKPSKLDAMLNDEAVKALLDEADPEAAFLVRLKMMRAHVAASEFVLKRGEAKEALNHITHPREEIYPEIEAAMRDHGMPDFGNVLSEAETAVSSGKPEAIDAAFMSINLELDKAEKSVDPAALQAGGIFSEALGLLLRAAVVEYHKAFEFSKLSNVVEYHDGAFFIAEARSLLAQAEPSLQKRDPENLTKLKDSFAKLEQAWPPETAPATIAMPVTKMQALVTIIELQVNKLH